MQAPAAHLEQPALPGGHEQLRAALLTDEQGVLTATCRRLARIAQARGIEAHAVDDVVQETLLEAWGHLDRLQSPAGFHLCIAEICRNVCRRSVQRRTLDLQRRAPLVDMNQQSAVTSSEEVSTSLLAIPDATAPDPLEELTRQELAGLLDRALHVLPEGARQFMAQHPRWLSTISALAEHAGQPALRFQLADLASSEYLTVLAQRHTLQVLAVY